MSTLELRSESKRNASPCPQWLFLLLGNACAPFALCVLLLQIPSPVGSLLFVIGFAAVPAVTAAAVAGSATRDHVPPSSRAARAAYFVLLFAVGVAIELAALWALLEVFWRGPQLGA